LPEDLEMICTEMLHEEFFFFLKSMSKITFGTPIFKTYSSKIKGCRRFFLKVRKTGKREKYRSLPVKTGEWD
jgi:hypothetical protein